MGRPKKAKPKTKAIRLSETQKRYAKMVNSIDADLGKKKTAIESLDKQIAKLQEQRKLADAERQNLEGAKKNLENILSQIPPPQEWLTFQKQVYEYHYHYHYHDCGCANRPCIHHPNIYIYPWWHYYGGGNYIYYPPFSQVTVETPSFQVPTTFNFSTSEAPNLGTVTNTPNLPTGSVVYTNNAGFAGPGVNTVMLCSSNGGEPTNGSSCFTSSVQASVTGLQEIGFFDKGFPAVDGADFSVSDLAKAIKQ